MCKMIGLIVSKLTAVFGDPWEILLFNYSIQIKTSEIWEDMKRKNDTPMVMLQRQSIKQKKV